MKLIRDLIRIVFVRWANCKKLIVLTTFNLTIGLCTLMFFVNIGYNINSYVDSNFLTNERLQHVLIYSDKKMHIPENSGFLKDENVNAARLIYDSNVDIKTIGEVDYSDKIYFDATIMDSPNILFEGEYMSDEAFLEKEDNWKSGVILSERCLAIFDGVNPMGEEVCFSYNGRDYILPITGIITSKAEENYDYDYKSFMYIFSNNISSLPEGLEAVDLRIDELASMEKFINTYTSDSYRIISNLGDVERLLALSRSISLIFIITGILFVLFTSLGIINSLSSMQEKNMKNICLTKIIGFSNSILWTINLIESIMIGIISAIAAVLTFEILIFIMRYNNLFHFEFINIDSLLSCNSEIIVVCIVASIVIVIVCKSIVLKKVKKNNIMQILKGE